MNDLVQFDDVLEEGWIQCEPDFDRDVSKWHGSDDLVARIEWWVSLWLIGADRLRISQRGKI